MHFTSLVCLSLFSVALAAPTPEPEPQGLGGLIPNVQGQKTITGALGMVQKSIDGLDTAVKAINSSDLTALAPLATKATAIGPTIMMAKTMIDGADNVGITDALAIQQSAGGLTDSLNTVADDLISKKSFIDQAGLSPTVVMLISQQKGSSGGLVTSVTNKLPALAQGLAGGQAQDVSAPLDKIIKAFNSTTPAAGAAPAPAAAAGAAAPSGAMKHRY